MNAAPLILVCPLPEGTERLAAVRQLGAAIARAAGLPAAAVTDNALERETSDSTYLGRGLAMPHARVVGLEYPVVAAAAVPGGIAWQGEEAQLLLMTAVPDACPEQHLLLVSRLLRWYTGELKQGREPHKMAPEILRQALQQLFEG